MDAASSERSWWVTMLALVVAAGISLLLGHVTTTTTQAVITNEMPEAGATPRRHLSMRASVALAAAGLAAAVAALALAPAPPAEARGAAEADRGLDRARGCSCSRWTASTHALRGEVRARPRGSRQAFAPVRAHAAPERRPGARVDDDRDRASRSSATA